MSTIAALFHRQEGSHFPSSARLSPPQEPSKAAHGWRTIEAKAAILQYRSKYRHLHAAPAENDEEQPLRDPHTGSWICFDGRLDNRQDLCSQLSCSEEDSDARLVLAAHRKWGDDCFGKLLGAFAVVLFAPDHHRLTLARDPMGSRTLFFHLSDRLAVVGSQESTVLAHPQVADTLNEGRVASFLAVADLVDGATFFRQVQELLPGQRITVTPEGCEEHRFALLRPDPNAALGDDRERAERLLATLDAAVRCRLHGVDRPAVMMSGGLDSTSIAALAAQVSDGPVRAVSWVFDEFSSCDERRYIAPMVERHQLEPIQFLGDDAWPLFALESWPFNPNTPEENLYRRLTDGAYATAREAGSPVMLTGMFADHLYTGNRHWLGDLLRRRRFATALSDLAWHLARRSAWSKLRQTLAPLLRGHSIASNGSQNSPAEWLTPQGRSLLRQADDRDQHLTGAHCPRPEQYRRVLGLLAAHGVSAEIFHTDRHGIELRNPYRDRRLVELLLGLPAFDLYRRGRFKPILRRAMAGRLPSPILDRTRPTALTPLYRRGIEERREGPVMALLNRPSAIWHHFVRSDWLLAPASSAIARGRRGTAGELVLWACVCLELWLMRRQEGRCP